MVATGILDVAGAGPLMVRCSLPDTGPATVGQVVRITANPDGAGLVRPAAGALTDPRVGGPGRVVRDAGVAVTCYKRVYAVTGAVALRAGVHRHSSRQEMNPRMST